VLDEKLDHRADGSLLQSESSDRVWVNRQADWKGLEVPALGISLQRRTSNNREESSGRKQFMAQVVRKERTLFRGTGKPWAKNAAVRKEPNILV